MSNLLSRYNGMVDLAVKEALKSTYKQKIGCVIFDKKKIISSGHNYPQKSVKHLRPKFKRWNSIRAEVSAVLNAKCYVKGMSAIIVRINKQNQFRLSKPCECCEYYLQVVGIKKIIYSISEYPYLKEM